MNPEQPTATAVKPERGRGALILVLGILSLVMFGLLTGIPAWVMGHTDLKRMREGQMESADEGLTRAGMILGIIGTVISALAILLVIVVVLGILSVVGIAVFEAKELSAQRDAIEAEMYLLAQDAYAHRMETGSYERYVIPDDLAKTDHAVYSVSILDQDRLSLLAKSRHRRGSIEATIMEDGSLVDWIYRGAFSENSHDDESNDQIFWKPVGFALPA